MSPLPAMVRVTARQLAGRSRVIGFALLAMVPAALLAASSRSADRTALDLEMGVLLVMPLFALVIPVITLILASSALGDERRDKTLSFLVLRPISRLEIATAKTLAAALVSTGFAVAGAVALTVVWMAIGGGPDVLLPMVIGAAAACLMYSSVFVLVGNVLSRATLMGLLYVLFFETIIVSELPRLAGASLWRIGLGATLDAMPGHFPARALLAAMGDWIPSLPSAALIASAVFAVSVAACTLLLTRTDAIGGRTES